MPTLAEVQAMKKKAAALPGAVVSSSSEPAAAPAIDPIPADLVVKPEEQATVTTGMQSSVDLPGSTIQEAAARDAAQAAAEEHARELIEKKAAKDAEADKPWFYFRIAKPSASVLYKDAPAERIIFEFYRYKTQDAKKAEFLLKGYRKLCWPCSREEYVDSRKTGAQAKPDGIIDATADDQS